VKNILKYQYIDQYQYQYQYIVIFKYK